MEARLKAIELVDKYAKVYYDLEYDYCDDRAKQCALIAVDEMLEEHRFNDSDYANRRFKYFQEVKQEILAL